MGKVDVHLHRRIPEASQPCHRLYPSRYVRAVDGHRQDELPQSQLPEHAAYVSISSYDQSALSKRIICNKGIHKSYECFTIPIVAFRPDAFEQLDNDSQRYRVFTIRKALEQFIQIVNALIGRIEWEIIDSACVHTDNFVVEDVFSCRSETRWVVYFSSVSNTSESSENEETTYWINPRKTLSPKPWFSFGFRSQESILLCRISTLEIFSMSKRLNLLVHSARGSRHSMSSKNSFKEFRSHRHEHPDPNSTAIPDHRWASDRR